MSKGPTGPIASKLAWIAVSLVALTAMVERGWLLFRTPLMPGMNGAYYLVQTRALIEQGKLGIPDLPLTFYIDAALAKIIQLLTNAPLEPSILLAVKLEDAILPALVALPVFALVRRWSSRIDSGLWLPTCAAIAVACGAPALTMVGDFEKNSLGLVWLATLLWRLHIWLEEPAPKNAALVVLFLTLVGLTHIGVFGWALALAGMAMVLALCGSEAQTRRRFLPWLVIGGVMCSLAAGLVLWKFDPARIERLAGAATNPFSYLLHNQMHHGNNRNFLPHNLPPTQIPGGQNGPPPFGPGGPGGPILFRLFPGVIFVTAAASALAALWYRRQKISMGDIAVVGGCALSLIVLCGPWVVGDKTMRFGLIAVGPTIIVTTFAIAQLPFPRIRHGISTVIAIALAGAGFFFLGPGGRPVITAAAAVELRGLSTYISAPPTTLIVARHGLEWWAAWFLHTHIAHADVLTNRDWQDYGQVFFLRQKAGMQPPFGPPGDGHFSPDRGLPGLAADPHGGAQTFPRFGPPGGGAMAEPVIPPDAVITHDGTSFTFALIKSPIAGLTSIQSTTDPQPAITLSDGPNSQQ